MRSKALERTLLSELVKGSLLEDMIRLELREHEARVLLEAIAIQLRSTKDSGKVFLIAVRDKLAIALLEQLTTSRPEL